MERESGQMLGSYRLQQQVGQGGMGEVWIAEHALLGRQAAIKILRPSVSDSEEMVTRFFNEARAAAAIADPGIVQIFDFGQSEAGAYIVMELLIGEPLDLRLDRVGALPVGDALRTMRQVATSLGAAHARSIVHRDLKPANIFLARDPEVAGGERTKILDFGIAKLTGDPFAHKTQTSALIGTPMYMSPEQCRGSKDIDARSDVYAIGCVLFHLLTGQPPFDAEGVGDLIVMHLTAAPPRASSLRVGIPAVVDAIIERCLAKDPAARFADGGEVAAALQQAIALRDSAEVDPTIQSVATRPAAPPPAVAVRSASPLPGVAPALPLRGTASEPPPLGSTAPNGRAGRASSAPPFGTVAVLPPVGYGPSTPRRAGAAPPVGYGPPTPQGSPMPVAARRAGSAPPVGYGTAQLPFSPVAPARPSVRPPETTLSSSVTELPSVPSAKLDLRILAGLGVVAVMGGIVAYLVFRPTHHDAPAPPVAAPVVAPAAAPPPPPDTRAADAEHARAQVAAAIAAYHHWSTTHRTGCPERADFGLADAAWLDPWGSALVITCTEQPKDQRVGVISFGPDRNYNTADDVRSWELGPAVTELARRAPEPPVAHAPPPKREPPPKTEPAPHKGPSFQGTSLGDDGIPTRR